MEDKHKQEEQEINYDLKHQLTPQQEILEQNEYIRYHSGRIW